MATAIFFTPKSLPLSQVEILNMPERKKTHIQINKVSRSGRRVKATKKKSKRRYCI